MTETTTAQPWHKLYDDAYEEAEAEAAGAVMGLKMARGEHDRPALGDLPVDDFRAAVAAAFDRGFQTARDEAKS